MILRRGCLSAGRAMQVPTRAESPSTRAGKLTTTTIMAILITTTIITTATATGEAGHNDARENDSTLVTSLQYGAPNHHTKKQSYTTTSA